MEGNEQDDRRPAWLAWVLSPYVVVAVIAAGVAFRVGLYLRNRVLWLDEAFLALNILDRDYGQLAEPLDYHQSAPGGYLWAVKGISEWWGIHEYPLRLVSLVAGVAALGAVYGLGRRVLDGGAAVIAVSIFAISAPLIRYASELKPYSLDVLFGVALTWAGVAALREVDSRRAAPWLAVIGVAAPWFSHASLFVFAGVWLVAAVWAFRVNGARRLIGLGFAGGAWAVSFGIHFWFFTRHTASDDTLRSWWVEAFMPMPPVTPSAVKWVLWSFTGMFEHPLGLVLPGMGAAAFLVGAADLMRRNRAALGMLVLPLVLALAASALHRYPFTERFLLFAAPSLAVIVGAGAGVITALGWRMYRPLALVFPLLLLAQPLLVAVNLVVARPFEGVRPALAVLAADREAGEPLYLYHWAQYEFRYYSRLEGFDDSDAILGITSRNDWSYYRNELEALRGHERVWVVLRDVDPKLGEGEEKYFRTVLEELGEARAVYWWKDARLYCYDLSGERRGDGPP